MTWNNKKANYWKIEPIKKQTNRRGHKETEGNKEIKKIRDKEKRKTDEFRKKENVK